jgi:type I restriction-modification system DNA methylase subunit
LGAEGRFRDRRGQVLFIDARKLGHMVDRTHRELTDEEIARISRTYHAWRGEKDADDYTDVAGFCKSATLEDTSASMATCSRRDATSELRRRRTTASRSRKR